MRMHAAKGPRLATSLMLCAAVWASSRATSAPHMDHEPKHGGVFFMAPDRFHHLEGVLLPTGTFKVYLYDDHTRPISATGFDAEMQLDGPGAAQKLRLGLDAADGTLSIGDLRVERFPVELTVWITFPGRAGASPQTELFSFSFDRFSKR